MQIDVKRNGLILIFLTLGLLLIATGWTGHFGLLLGAVFTPEYLSVQEQT